MRPLCLLSFLLLCGQVLSAQVALTTLGSAYTQNFDTLANTGTSSSLPSGWLLAETGTNANTTYTAGTGSGTAGDTYSFGAAGSTERAFGMLQSGSLIPTIGAAFTNNTGATITSLTISYTGEQWRLGTINRGADRLDFQYSLDATSLATGTWADVNTLDFSSPFTATVGAVDGNAAANRTALSATITGLLIAPGATFYIRWADFNASGADDGLSVDDFSITPQGDSGVSTNPTASGTASPVAAGATTTISGTITAGANPTSTGLAVACNLTSVGGSATQAIAVTGLTFSDTYLVPANVAASNYTLPCTVSDSQGRSNPFSISLTVTTPFNCGGPKTLISAVQGPGAASPLVGQIVEIEGVVTGDFQPSTKLGGFFLQDTTPDADPLTSEGIFVSDGGTGLDVNVGDLVRVRGTVAEVFNQTVLNTVTNKLACGTGAITPVDITFPVASATALEQYEGMLVRFPQQLRVTDNYDLGLFNEISLAWVPNYAPGATFTRLMVGTQVALPGAPALAVSDLNSRSRIVLDDGSNRTYANLTPAETYPLDGGGLSATNTVRLGDRVNVDAGEVYTPLVGVLGFDFSKYRVHPTGPVTFGPSDNPRPAAAPAVGGRVKVVSAYVLNYFTTYNSRGATNQAEFIRQRAKIINAIRTMDPAVIALSELENNTTASAEDLVNDAGPNGPFGDSLNTGNPGKWAYINTGVVGTDLIRVAFLYQPALVSPIGVHKVLSSSVDARVLDGRNRPSIAQTFKLLSGGKPSLQHFTVVVNHFKSKGSACTPDDPDASDGQDNCNRTRISIAQALIDWLAANPTADPTPAADRRILLVGDLNAYLKEDPLMALTSTTFSKPSGATTFPNLPANPNAVYKDLVGTIGDAAGYSYLFSGESGALDHALANPALFRLVTAVSEWHINADEPVVLDYNTDFQGNSSTTAKSAAQIATYFSPGAFRASDHDPIILGFNPLPGDLNDDGIVSTADQALLNAQINKPLTAANRRMDYDGDGVITLNDYRIWANYYRAYLLAPLN